MAIRIALTGAGSGGHLFPLVTVAKYLKKTFAEKQSFDFMFFGPMTKLEKEVMEKEMIPYKKVMSGKMRRYFSLLYFFDILKLPIGLLQALWQLFWYMPDVVFSKGGYASVPTVVAAKIYRIPVLIHESDAAPGMANNFLGSIANRVAITFERSRIHFPAPRTVLTGNPVKEEAIGGSREKGREFLNMHNESKPVILFLGGSQGAKTINDRILGMLDDLVEKYQVVHQTGISHYKYAFHEAQKRGYKIGHSDYYPMAFIKEELRDVIAVADVVVSRAGSTAISEIAANKKASILVPITRSANNHQRLNAYEVSKAGGAIVLEEDNFRKNLLLDSIEKLLKDGRLRAKLESNISKFHHPEATSKIADELLALAKS